MTSAEKKNLRERDICTKFITLARVSAGWDVQTQIRESVNLTKGRVMVSVRTYKRGESKRMDYLLYYKPNLPFAEVEAKDKNHTLAAGMQQALGYADILKDVPFVFSSYPAIKNPHDPGKTLGDPDKRLAEYQQLPAAVDEAREKLKRELQAALER